MKENDIIETKKRAMEVLERLRPYMRFDGECSISLKDLSDMYLYVTDRMEGISKEVDSSYKEDVLEGMVASLYIFYDIGVAKVAKGNLFENLRKEINDMGNEKKDSIIVCLLVYFLVMFCSFIIYSIDEQLENSFIDWIPVHMFNVLSLLGKQCLDSLSYIDVLESKVNDMRETIDSLQLALKDI